MSVYPDLSDKSVVITGANGDIGLAICEKYLNLNCQVFAVAHSHQNMLQQLKSSHPRGDYLIIKSCDITDADQVQKLVAELEQQIRCVHVLVNNAGLCSDNLFSAMNYEQFDRVIKVNLYGTFNLCKSLLGMLRSARGATVVNVSSVAGVTASFGQVNYSAAKAGINGLTRSLAAEYAAKGIRINAVAPGMIESKMVKKVPRQIVQTVVSATPLKRLGRAEEIADAIAFLSSSASGFIVGQTLVVDGGLVMR
ncbi:3-oxoacyl-ACP reductase FabG [Winslowiella iniecta]|uniref:3-oxoacyl-[acyl-carrier-protein] reductase FabG n=1 Tax=Winslowiella iniecta TaxID=1560201 RepID=A0A0L7T189_9GAMM|nr:3-oxoacyl-ACP reductase FabG [Winslowiella iniecta]KOC89162.1 3-oxoacyl-ACP reductase [Winslowiella iniecta]KOC93005.1 3-oxoacyl-ACP reductase [Winslowiella iniecta]